MRENPFNEVFGILHQQMNQSAGKALAEGWVYGELGMMTADMGLKLDRFKHVIYDYILADHLTLAEPDMTTTENDGAHADPVGGTHTHQVITPAPLLPLHPGDRVLAIPVNEGQDFVITVRVKAR